MIFVILGTQDKPFTRLLKAIDQIETSEEIIVQAGCTVFHSEKMKIFDYVSMDDFQHYLAKADLIITHGGVGSIMQGLNLNKKIIAVARLGEYGEHHNDHQLDICQNFALRNHILTVEDLSKLADCIKESETFTPAPYTSNNQAFVAMLSQFIKENV
ncbi:MAG: PssE/Cps14G family polysaccharide biosynthesis glycosyltransferase [Erysipelotrichaceae bacterium]